MKKTLTTLVAAVGIAANASAATLVGEWSDFSSLSSTGGTGSLALVTSGSTSVQEGVLNVVGASGGTATVDLTNAGLTQAKGITIFMSVSNVGSFNGGGPFGLVSLAATGQDFAALCGYADGSNTVSFARNGSVKNVTTNLPTTGSDISSLKGDRPMTFTLTLDSTRFAAYLNGKLVASATGNFDSYAYTKMAFGSWAGTSGYGRLSESIHSLAIYDGAMTAAEVSQLVPEPATAALGLLAFAGLAARRRRK